ncbi:NADH dehydrogenase 1 beta subcomplex subunit 3 [Thamnocephalis sphaerospora]|uniref:NADH dehydrogenase 1 beta subcomplex subunit 3 n=1 Tax=Thamnocephalis sphaerospora TaxID=78915 RepID=A0A4V1IXC4_9FUNG|nr:NADH dehydrogenase 1 beta subcomplex subunit 3 [Thamnocephalis sphaerospora]|eukprot:RKP10569.1 NADH dehydrogenase 1 beta subcomplex subunit 3 [Thamnocephalis sphaerospora]
MPQSSSTVRRDPWAKLEAWRKHPVFSRTAQLRASFPGLGIATVAFAAYCGVEWALTKKSDKPAEGHH